MSRGVRRIVRRGRLYLVAAYWLVRRTASRARLTRLLPDGARIQLGCGPNRFEGWINVDVDRRYRPDVVHDLRLGLPARPGSAELIYSEHVLEHLTLAEGTRLLRDCRRALRHGGVMRIAMPDLRSLVDHYLKDWRNQAWLCERAYREIDSAARMLNYALREWGHKYVYDSDDLEMRLRAAGFAEVHRRAWRESPHAELCNRETREDSTLIVEAVAI